MKPLYEAKISGAFYQVFYDEDHKFSKEEQELKEFCEKNGLEAYIVDIYAPCDCNCPKCTGWKPYDSCHGILEERPENAIIVAMESV